MATNLGSQQIGGADLAYKWYLHTSGTALTAGAVIGNGNGDDSALKLWDDRVGVVNGAFHTSFAGSATANRALILPDASGTVALGDGSGITDAAAFKVALGITVVKLAANQTNATVTAADLTGITFTPAVSSTYRFEGLFPVQSATAANAVILTLKGPAEVEYVVGQATIPTQVSHGFGVDGANKFQEIEIAGWDDEIAATDASGIDTPHLIKISGIFTTTASAPTTPVKVQIHSETAATDAVALKGGCLIFTKL